MLVCLSPAVRVSAVAFLLALSLDWVLRCSRSHLCSGSDIRRKRVSSTELLESGELGVMPVDSSTAPNNCLVTRAAPSGVSGTKRLGLSS